MPLEPRRQSRVAAVRPALRCPRCGASLSRIRRNALDRLVSLLAPRRRYRCRAFGCGWTGTLIG
jgi:hypothetical protein